MHVQRTTYKNGSSTAISAAQNSSTTPAHTQKQQGRKNPINRIIPRETMTGSCVLADILRHACGKHFLEKQKKQAVS